MGQTAKTPSMALDPNTQNTGTVNTGVDRSVLSGSTPSINLGLSGGISADIATALGGNRATETPNAASTANLTDSQLTAAIMADAAAKTGTTVSPSATSVLAGLSNNTATQPTTSVLSSIPGGGGTISTGGGITGGGGTGGTGGGGTGGTGGTGLGTTGTMSIGNIPTGGSDNIGGSDLPTPVTPVKTTQSPVKYDVSKFLSNLGKPTYTPTPSVYTSHPRVTVPQYTQLGIGQFYKPYFPLVPYQRRYS